MKIKLLSTEYKNTSFYGNPSYWVYYTDSDGNFGKAYTASNAACGYSVTNYHRGDILNVEIHVTKKGSCIIDMIHEK